MVSRKELQDDEEADGEEALVSNLGKRKKKPVGQGFFKKSFARKRKRMA